MPGSEVEPPADDDAAAVAESGPNRRCIVTAEVGAKSGLLRFVVGPDGSVLFDAGHRLPGRGIWLSPRRDMVNTAVTKRLFARAARRAVTVSEDLAGQVERTLVRRCLDGLGLARRAGQAVCGFEKVSTEVRAGHAAVVLAARDAGHDGRGKIRAMVAGQGRAAMIELFDGAELGPVFGRDAVVHVCVSSGRLASRLIDEAALLAGFRSDGAE